ncbi:EamA family transporter [Roseibium sp. RKSG952]|uniref:EamA family transporter n=1 Tax=Roseibium sp. RKSG952 TaxID=2529384 RepID=UPI0012BD2A31|nr:EamA family transporter [Roseibium sp. RKSG952]MTH95746.1 EamA family transporter [Roseibium sp. RKSG952]
MRLTDIFLAVLVAALWGFNFVVIHLGIDAFPPLMFSALRFVLAAFPLVFFLPRPKTGWGIILGIGTVLGVVKFALLFLGMDTGLSAGLASLVLQSQAFFTVILAALLLSERPSARQLAGIALAFTGIGIVALTMNGQTTHTGLTLVLSAAMAWALSNLLMKKAGQVNMLSLMVWVSLVPPIPLICLSLIFEGWQASADAITGLDLTGVGAVLYIAYAATIFGFAVWGKLISQYGAGTIAPFSLLVPVFGMTSSAVFLGEDLGATKLLAAALVISGLILTVLKPSKITRPLAGAQSRS